MLLGCFDSTVEKDEEISVGLSYIMEDGSSNEYMYIYKYNEEKKLIK